MAHVFNVKSISKKVKNQKIPNLYHRLYYLLNGGAVNTVSEELIEEVIEILDSETKDMKKFLADVKKRLAKQE